MEREFILRRMSAEIHALRRAGDPDQESITHIVDKYTDHGDATHLKLRREAEDIRDGLTLIDWVYWHVSVLWDRTMDEEMELDWEARDVRGHFGEWGRMESSDD